MAKQDEDRRARMRELLAEQEASGLSVARFARERGVPAWTLYEGRRRLPKDRGVRARGSKQFVQLKVLKVGADHQVAATMAVELVTGMRVHVPAGFEADELRRLLGVLAAC